MTETKCVYCAVRTEDLNIILMYPSLQLFIEAACMTQRALFTVMKNVSEKNINF
jgi:hypothetical protein